MFGMVDLYRVDFAHARNGDSIAIVVSGDTDLNQPYTIHACIPYYKLGRYER